MSASLDLSRLLLFIILQVRVFTSPHNDHDCRMSCPIISSCPCLTLFLFFSSVAGQPKAFLTRAHREAGVCSSQVGSRIQGVPRQHGWLHESSGLPVRFILLFLQGFNLFLVGQY